MTSPARPYRFPAPPPEKEEPATRCTAQSCGTCGASAVASCVALCCCPCAVVSCLTLALVKAPYMAGRRCVVRLARSRRRGALRKATRVRDLDDVERQGDLAAKVAALPRRSKEWGELDGTTAAVVAGGRARTLSSRTDSAEKMWAEIYQVGLWGFGRLSFSAAGVGVSGDSEKGNDDAAE
ncbi:hypothetical protein ACP70R_037926 [Stipagrostis hirtigluma subsp. patula]